ncbi:retron St85 family RNA-directed DNA polymerase [Aeromonas hydrophila]|uniref:retron St85 family RNA-directed DNA polymerase n=1 Tax=Aeromonas hydrophila TaxID=644 RepID=UPI00140FD6EC|nr:retron St85 family RNA-directed DNA polymerase [Aeromonas hydrophila]NHT35348.1 RNA-directed DNA polymerase [Aeromonas hydrophila]
MNIVSYVCDSLCIDEKQLMLFAATAPHRYKKYEIPKRSGHGTRTIAHPSKQLKFIQRLVISQLENVASSHKAAVAYIKGLSIKDNAILHAKNSFLLKMDFRDFFHSITPELMFQTYEQLGVSFSIKDREFLSNILFYKLRKNSHLRLSIGAPSSPFISNIVMHHFDSSMSNYCSENDIIYTRYADDLTFSSNTKGILFPVPDEVRLRLDSTGYGSILINTEKTIFTSKKHNRHVTGITISNDSTPSIGRQRKRNLSAAIHRFSLEKMTEKEIEKLKGDLSFAFFVEPEFKVRMKQKYGEEIYGMLFKKNN